MKMKLLVALVKNGNTQNVRRQQVRRELQTAETRVNRAGQRLGQRRFARAGIIFQQHMSARRKGCQQVPRRRFLAAHDFGDVGADVAIRFARGFKVDWCHVVPLMKQLEVKMVSPQLLIASDFRKTKSWHHSSGCTSVRRKSFSFAPYREN